MNPIPQVDPVKLLQSRDAIASALMVLLIDHLGVEIVNMEPDTLIEEIKTRWKITPPEFNRDKIWSLATVMATDLFLKDLNVFNHVANALSGKGASFEHFAPADITEVCWMLAEIAIFDPDALEGKFSDEIEAYILAKLNDEGLQKLPRILKRFLRMPDQVQVVNDALSGDGIDFKAYWEEQERNLLKIDMEVQNRMMMLVTQVASLPLQHASPGALQDLLKRAQKALVAQSRQTEREQADVPQSAFL